MLTWEDYTKLLAAFPSHHLEDKVNRLVSGIFMEGARDKEFTYKRRKKGSIQKVIAAKEITAQVTDAVVENSLIH